MPQFFVLRHFQASAHLSIPRAALPPSLARFLFPFARGTALPTVERTRWSNPCLNWKMGCTVREKHIRTNRKVRSAKIDVDQGGFLLKNPGSTPYPLSVHDSSLSPDINRPNPNLQNPCFDGFSIGYSTEEQLEEVLLKNLEFLYNEAISKLVNLGYDEDIALKAILLNGHCYGGMDVLTNILHNALTYLNSGSCSATGTAEENELVFTDIRQLEECSLAGMVCLLQQVRPHLTKADAMWCLLVSDLHVGRASTIDIPVIPPHNGDLPAPVMNVESAGNAAATSTDDASGFCRFHGGWGFGNGGTSELPVKEIECPRRFNLSPSMKSLLKRNVAAFAAGFKANSQSHTQPQAQTQACGHSDSPGDASKVGAASAVHAPVADSSKGAASAAHAPAGNASKGDASASHAPAEQQSEETNDSKNQDVINSLLSKFQDLKLDSNLETVSDDQKDEILLTLMHQVKELEKKSNDRKEWAQQKVMQAARRLSQDLTELNLLKMNKDDIEEIRKTKDNLDAATTKRVFEMETALRQGSAQLDRATSVMKQLEVENAEIKAEMEASKLSASESAKTCLEVEKWEKRCQKRLVAWEKQKSKLQQEIAAEKRKFCGLQLQLVKIKAAQKEAEVKWRQEVKGKESAAVHVEEERRGKEAAEANNKRKVEALRLQIDIDFQRHKDDLQRLEQDLCRLKAAAESSAFKDSSADTISGGGNSEVLEPQGVTIARLLRELDEQDENTCEKEIRADRECLVCRKDEVSVVLLPCAHQVMCANCGENYGKKGKAPVCPCCRVPVERKIRVYGASS